jgi:hypothetical protein
MQKAGIKPEKTSNWVGNNSVFFGADQVRLACVWIYSIMCGYIIKSVGNVYRICILYIFRLKGEYHLNAL